MHPVGTRKIPMQFDPPGEARKSFPVRALSWTFRVSSPFHSCRDSSDLRVIFCRCWQKPRTTFRALGFRNRHIDRVAHASRKTRSSGFEIDYTLLSNDNSPLSSSVGHDAQSVH